MDNKKNQTIYDVGKKVKLGNREICAVEAVRLGVVKRLDFEKEYDREWIYQTGNKNIIISEDERDEIWNLYKKYNKNRDREVAPKEKYIELVPVFITNKEEFYSSWTAVLQTYSQPLPTKLTDEVRVAWRAYRNMMIRYLGMITNSHFTWYYFDKKDKRKTKLPNEISNILELTYLCALQGKDITHNTKWLDGNGFIPDFTTMDASINVRDLEDIIINLERSNNQLTF